MSSPLLCSGSAEFVFRYSTGVILRATLHLSGATIYLKERSILKGLKAGGTKHFLEKFTLGLYRKCKAYALTTVQPLYAKVQYHFP
jgi:hypothetical protein